MLFGIIFLLIFLLFAVLMYFKKIPTLLALPAMAVSFAIVAGVSPQSILKDIISDGSIRLHLAMVTMIFAGIMAQFIKNTGIADAMIRRAAEFAGDNPFMVALTLAVVVALLFTVLGGLGAAAMVAIIIIPILLSLGFSNLTAACLFVMGISLGGILNLANWQLYIDTLGLTQGEILKFALPFFGLFILILFIFLFRETRRWGTNFLLSNLDNMKSIEVPILAFLTPIIPVLLVFGFSIYNIIAKPSHPFEFPIIAAFVIGLIYGSLIMLIKRKDVLNLLTKSIFEGVNIVAPAIILLMGIGMVLNAAAHPTISKMLIPLFSKILPSAPISYVLFFSILAPLALYRGPLNIWGLGSGLVGIMLAVGALPPVAIMAALLSVGQIQGVCDPTNSYNVWLASFLRINVQDILRKTLPFIWFLAVLGLILASFIAFPKIAAAVTFDIGVPDSIMAENNSEKNEIYRIEIANKYLSPISISLDKGETWQEIGKVLHPADQFNFNGYTASKWVLTGEVAATAVNAIHLKAGYNSEKDRGIIFSILPKEFLNSAHQYKMNSSIITDIPAGQKIFGSGYSPYIGDTYLINQDSCSQECSLETGDTITIIVTQPNPYPKEIVFENRFGGLITIKYLNGQSKVIGEVLRPVLGIGRFVGTQYAEVGRIRANHAGVIDISTSPMDKIGGFQIIPAHHGMSEEMSNARIKTQWMVVGPPNVLDPSIEGRAPLFKYFMAPSYNAVNLDEENLEEILLRRFIVQVKYKNQDNWKPMPSINLDPDLRKELPNWANRAFENVSELRILFPIYKD